MQKEDRFFAGHHVRKCPFFCPKTNAADVHFSAQKQVKTQKKRSSSPQMSIFPLKTSADQKKGHHVRRPQFALKISKIFRERMIQHVFTVHNAEKEDI